MYTLYYLPGACSLATQVVLRELNQEVTLINKNQTENFEQLNPVGTVPVLLDGDKNLREGAAVMFHILNKHENELFPASGAAREKAIQDIMFANATMHPAYGRLFFIAQTLEDGTGKDAAFAAAADAINHLWQVVEQNLGEQRFLGGETLSAADVMLAVYSAWGEYFPVEISLGENTQRMLDAVKNRPSFNASVAAEAA